MVLNPRSADQFQSARNFLPAQKIRLRTYVEEKNKVTSVKLFHSVRKLLADRIGSEDPRLRTVGLRTFTVAPSATTLKRGSLGVSGFFFSYQCHSSCTPVCLACVAPYKRPRERKDK